MRSYEIEILADRTYLLFLSMPVAYKAKAFPHGYHMGLASLTLNTKSKFSVRTKLPRSLVF